MALSDDLAVFCFLSGTRQRRRSSFSVLRRALDRGGREPSPPGFKRSGSSAAAMAPQGMRRRHRLGKAVLAMKPLALDLVTHLPALAGVRGMRQDRDATAAGLEQREREENRWIKSG